MTIWMMWKMPLCKWHTYWMAPCLICYFIVKLFSYGGIQKYTDICFQSATRMQFFGVKKWCSPNVFSDTKQKYVCWKICKVRKVFDCVAGAYYFQCQVCWGLQNEWGFLSGTVLWNEWSFLLVFAGFETFC